MSQRESLGSRLGRLRRETELSLADVAERVGVSVPSVWAWEKGKSSPRKHRIPALAEALQVAEKELLVSEHEGELPAQTLEEEITRSKARIADLAGTTADKVRIEIEH